MTVLGCRTNLDFMSIKFYVDSEKLFLYHTDCQFHFVAYRKSSIKTPLFRGRKLLGPPTTQFSYQKYYSLCRFNYVCLSFNYVRLTFNYLRLTFNYLFLSFSKSVFHSVMSSCHSIIFVYLSIMFSCHSITISHHAYLTFNYV